ncbi:MAG: hypothetical protein QM740_04030 [Acidovorax sp.]
MLVVGEDALCCALGERLVAAMLPGWELAGPSIDTKGVTKLIAALPRYAVQAQHVQPVLCVADTDGQCVKQWLGQHLPRQAQGRFVLRLAVNEAESWLLADREGLAQGLQVASGKLPRQPDEVMDAKGVMLQMLGKSKLRHIRDEAVSRTNPARQGPGYNLHLCEFVHTAWSAERARQVSPSLARACEHLRRVGEEHV